MSWAGSLPYFKIFPFVLYMVLYFSMTEAHKRYPDENYKSVIFKLLPMTSLVFMVLSCASQNKEHGKLKRFIVLGLLFSMAGDACLVWRIKLFIPGLLFFAIAHCIYTCGYGMEPFGGALPFLFCVVCGGGIFKYLLDGIQEPIMKILVLFYTIVIFFMAWRTLVRIIQNFNLGNFCGFIGALFFIASDFMIGVDKFKFPVKDASYWIMISYYTGQLGIALSACYNPEHLVSSKHYKKTN